MATLALRAFQPSRGPFCLPVRAIARPRVVPAGYPAWNRDGQTPPLTGSAGEVADQFRSFASEGVDHIQAWVNPTTPAGVEQLGKTVELLRRT
jgi:hypothetical protein